MVGLGKLPAYRNPPLPAPFMHYRERGSDRLRLCHRAAS